jgi:POT family proton-dependent oligopeptide transporter
MVIGTACVMAIVFWMVYEQSGNTMVLFINSSVDRTMGKFTVPTEWFQSINPFFILGGLRLRRSAALAPRCVEYATFG